MKTKHEKKVEKVKFIVEIAKVIVELLKLFAIFFQ